MTVGSLSGLRVLVTRPAGQQEALCRLIIRAGGEVASLPLLRIEAIDDPDKQKQIKRRVLELDGYELLIFISSNAAQLGGQWIADYWPQFPVATDVLAIGATTARSLRAQLDCPISLPDQGMTSEDLLALPRLQDVGGQRVAIFRGEGGRELLAGTLRERGASVDYLEVYRRQPIDYPQLKIRNLLGADGVNAITISSGESLQHLCSLAGDNKARLTLLPLVVPSLRIADLGADLGFTDIIQAAAADADSYLLALQEYAGRADSVDKD